MKGWFDRACAAPDPSRGVKDQANEITLELCGQPPKRSITGLRAKLWGAAWFGAAAAVTRTEADVLAYLRRKQSNAAKLAASSSAADDDRDRAAIMARQYSVLIDDLTAGLHHGEAAAGAS